MNGSHLYIECPPELPGAHELNRSNNPLAPDWYGWPSWGNQGVAATQDPNEAAPVVEKPAPESKRSPVLDGSGSGDDSIIEFDSGSDTNTYTDSDLEPEDDIEDLGDPDTNMSLSPLFCQSPLPSEDEESEDDSVNDPIDDPIHVIDELRERAKRYLDDPSKREDVRVAVRAFELAMGSIAGPEPDKKRRCLDLTGGR